MVFQAMTRPELDAVDKHALVILPVGSMEQHGPHLPVDTDTRLVTAVCQALERRLPGQTMLAPTVWLGHSPHHLSFGGTISLHHETCARVLTEVIENFYLMGYRKLLMVNGHGGNALPMAMALQEAKLRMPEMMALACPYWEMARDEILALREGGSYAMGHACELETSLYLYLAEDSVRIDKIRDAGDAEESGFFGMGMFNGGPVSYVADFKEFTDTGVFGRPTLASAEKGERMFAAIVGGLERFVRDIHSRERVFERE